MLFRSIGFDGMGHQVRDCLHPKDLLSLLKKQINYNGNTKSRICNLSGGINSARSLRQISTWCAEYFGFKLEIGTVPKNRTFDVPWIVLDANLAREQWGWHPDINTESIMEEIAVFASQNKDWLEISKN